MLVLGRRHDRLFLTSPHLRLAASRSSGFVNGLDRCSLIALSRRHEGSFCTTTHGKPWKLHVLVLHGGQQLP
uniref:Uncharacterized protein n=1 Tax=Triticum urartu TaxID=4572 RepID=A0A8R7QUN9_TRIUA